MANSPARVKQREAALAPARARDIIADPARAGGAAMAWDVYDRAKAMLRAGDAAAARALLAAQADPGELWSDFACLDAECLCRLGDHRRAAEVLERAAARGATNQWVFHGLAREYRELGAHARAAAASRRVHGLLGWPESERRGYEFTHDFFSANIATWTRWFAELIVAGPIDCLEIGSWQGASAAWLLDKVVGPRGGSLTCIDTFAGSSEHAAMMGELGATLEETFDRNIARTGRRRLARKLVGASQDVLRRLAGERFDFIYVDGAHEAKYVIQDAVLSWPLLREGGFLLFDDTGFEFEDRPEQNTGPAIASFRRWFADEIEALTPDSERQLLIRKRGG